MKKLVALGLKVLIIPDLHFPYAHQDWHAFLKKIKEAWSPDLIICLGDETDGHAISYHESDSSLFNADQELEEALEELKHLRDLFPKMYFLESNHGSLIFRRMKSNGIPLRHLVPLHELYEAPEWSWYHDLILETENGFIYFCHGKSSAYGKLARELGCSAVQGHFHGKFEITWHRTAMSERFNMFCGCLVDEKSMAMAYAKNNLPKPMLGVGWINELGEPSLIRMKLNKEGRWDEKL
jgi:predicted MPP superfamily phosphohydrolase